MNFNVSVTVIPTHRYSRIAQSYCQEGRDLLKATSPSDFYHFQQTGWVGRLECVSSMPRLSRESGMLCILSMNLRGVLTGVLCPSKVRLSLQLEGLSAGICMVWVVTAD